MHAEHAGATGTLPGTLTGPGLHPDASPAPHAARAPRAGPAALSTLWLGSAKPASLLSFTSPTQQPRGSKTARLLGAQANAACLSTSGKLLTEKIDVMRLTFYIAPITAVFILPLLLHVEVRGLGPERLPRGRKCHAERLQRGPVRCGGRGACTRGLPRRVCRQGSRRARRHGACMHGAGRAGRQGGSGAGIGSGLGLGSA